jgi:hypothetical protein
MYNDMEWQYKGYKVLIEFDVEPDNVKAFHYITTPKGETHMLDISPYVTEPATVNKIIDDFVENGLDISKVV